MATKKELLQQEVAKAVGAGKVVSLETVDFNDPNRPKTCLEVDFPILSVNQVATIEAASGAAKKPIYQMSKYWARRQSSVFRSMLLAAATKSPEDKSYASKQLMKFEILLQTLKPKSNLKSCLTTIVMDQKVRKVTGHTYPRVK